MGFDLSITLNLRISPTTGLPFVYGKDFSELPYLPSDFEVPEKYRKWVKQRGHHFHFYIKGCNKCEIIYETDVFTFLDAYPDWETVLKDIGDNSEYVWTWNDHNDFMEALRWFDTKNNFKVEWSY
jgi:hypothetical protein